MLDDFVERQTRTLRGNQVLIGVRLLLATVSLAVLIMEEVQAAQAKKFSNIPEPLYSSPPGLVAIIVCGLTILYVLAAAKSEKTPRLAFKLAFLQVFVDIFLISALVWNTGGVDSQFVVLYLISICAAAFVLKWNVSIMAAAASTILFCLVTVLYSMDIIPASYRIQATKVHLGELQHLSVLDFVRFLLLPVCAFFLTALLAGTLSRRLAMARLLHDEILEGIGEGILVVDTTLKTEYYNKEFEHLLGLKAHVGQSTLSSLLGKTVVDTAQEVFGDNTMRRIEVTHARNNGTSIPLSIRLIPIKELDGVGARGMILALDDITAEKKIEQFAKHKQRIETMGHISATIAHEIRNPLASIRGAVQEIGRSLKIPEDKKILIEIVLSESDRLDQIITDFLKFARMRPPKYTAADVSRLLEDFKLMLNARPEAKGSAITLSGSSGTPFPVDPEQLRQMFWNLGLNALQAMDGRERKALSIRIAPVSLHSAPGFPRDLLYERVDRPGLMIEFEDSGAGMPAAVARQIFEPFYTTKSTGTGLGLAIVERIIQAHDGIITVESIEDHGTIFRLWLPSDLKVGATVSGALPAIALN